MGFHQLSCICFVLPAVIVVISRVGRWRRASCRDAGARLASCSRELRFVFSVMCLRFLCHAFVSELVSKMALMCLSLKLPRLTLNPKALCDSAHLTCVCLRCAGSFQHVGEGAVGNGHGALADHLVSHASVCMWNGGLSAAEANMPSACFQHSLQFVSIYASKGALSHGTAWLHVPRACCVVCRFVANRAHAVALQDEGADMDTLLDEEE